MKTITIEKSLFSFWQLVITRDVREGVAYPVLAQCEQGELDGSDVEASYHSTIFIDDAGDKVSLWTDTPGITITEVAE